MAKVGHADCIFKTEDSYFDVEGNLMITDLDLMDWKQIERTSTMAIQEHKVSIVISEILLKEAEIMIHKLKGLTIAEEIAEDKKNEVKALNSYG